MPGPELTAERRYPGAWHAIADFLTAHGTDTVFGLPADDLAALHALQDTDIRVLLTRDQRNAGFLATGYAQASGRPGVVLVGKGPATSNVLTGLLEARSAATPVVVLAAGTAARARGSGAFQELDQLALVGSLVNWAYRVDHVDRLVPAIEKAFLAAVSGTPGPVYVEIADDLLTTEIVRSRPWREVTPQYPRPEPDVDEYALRVIADSRRPVILLGGGMRHRNGDGVVERLATELGAAVFTTASGRGAVDEDHPGFCGLAGLYSPPEAADVWQGTDLVIALGSRLEETATYGAGFAPAGTTVLQVNVSATELSMEYPGPAVVADAGATVRDWSERIAAGGRKPDADWIALVTRCRSAAEARVAAELDRVAGEPEPHIAAVLAALAERLPADHVLVQENGLQDMWSYFHPYWRCAGPAGSIVPSEQTSLGYGAAAAGGVKLAAPERTVVALVGDGAFGMLGADLTTLATEGIGVLFVVLNNGGYGWLQSQLDAAAGPSRFRFVGESTTLPLDARVEHAVVRRARDLAPALDRCLAACASDRVAVLEVAVRLSDVPADLSPDGDFPAQH